MAEVTIRLPGLLAEFADGDRDHRVDATTVDECVATLLETHPALHPHVHDDAGNLREHLQVFVNKRNVEWIAADPVPVKAGDVVEIFQAVSGG